MKKNTTKEVLEKINWGSVLVDVVIIATAGLTKNWYLLWLLMLTGGYELKLATRDNSRLTLSEIGFSNGRKKITNYRRFQ